MKKAKRSSKPQVQSSVWIPATGKKYHRIPNCGNMNPNRARKVPFQSGKATWLHCLQKMLSINQADKIIQ